MLKNTAKIATFAIAGSLVFGGSMLAASAQNAYHSTAVAGITLSVNDYVSSIEDAAPAVSTDTAAQKKVKKDSGKHKKLVMANVENVVNVRKKGSTNAKVVGQMYKGDAGKLVKKGKNWSKIKSGNVTGWVRNDFLFYGDKAYSYASKICNKVATVKTTTLNVREKKSTKADIVTMVPEGGKYTIKNQGKKWVKIAVDEDCKGYVSADYVDIKIKYGKALTLKEISDIEKANEAAQQQQLQQAQQQQAAQQTQTQTASAGTSTTTTTKTATAAPSTTKTVTNEQSVSTIKPTRKASSAPSSSSSSATAKNSGASSSFSGDSSVSSSSTNTSNLGSQVASYALQFVGNPYVYGGTSLTNGADCSGFTMSVYAHFGYGLSRTAAAQAGNGTSVSFSNLQPGDLIFYNNGGGIGHVALYIGGGQVVHASNRRTGIKISAYNYRTPCKAVRIIK